MEMFLNNDKLQWNETGRQYVQHRVLTLFLFVYQRILKWLCFIPRDAT